MLRTRFKQHATEHATEDTKKASIDVIQRAKLLLKDAIEDFSRPRNMIPRIELVVQTTDSAFEKIPHHHKPSKEVIKAVLLYYISPDFYPADCVLVTHTISTLLKSDSLGAQAHPQRLSISLGLKGVTLNYYIHVNAINVFGSNGVEWLIVGWREWLACIADEIVEGIAI